MTDSSKAKYIIGNMVIPVTDKIEAVLKGNYCTDNLVRYVRSNPEHIMFLEGSLMVTDWEGFDRWIDKTMECNIERIKVKLDQLICTQNGNDALLINSCSLLKEVAGTLADILREQREARGVKQPKPTLFQRIFKRKK